jgi:hypothetical protein
MRYLHVTPYLGPNGGSGFQNPPNPAGLDLTVKLMHAYGIATRIAKSFAGDSAANLRSFAAAVSNPHALIMFWRTWSGTFS